MLRRELNLGLLLFALTPRAWTSNTTSRGPLFWLATRGKARVFLLGFADAKANDESWFTPAIRKAFEESAELWLETAPQEALANRDPADKAKAQGKPANVVEKIVESGLKTFYKEVCLLDQGFIFDDKKSVAQALKEAEAKAGAPIKIAGFARFALGEGIERPSGDFGGEVAALAGTH